MYQKNIKDKKKHKLGYQKQCPLLISGEACSVYPRYSRNYFKLKCKLAERYILLKMYCVHYNTYIINLERMYTYTYERVKTVLVQRRILIGRKCITHKNTLFFRLHKDKLTSVLEAA